MGKKDDKKPAIIIRVPGFGNMNSGPMVTEDSEGPVEIEIPEEDD